MADSPAKPTILKIIANGCDYAVDGSIFLSQFLLIHLGIDQGKGIAVSVNLEVVPRSLWAGFELKNNDMVLVIQATQGG